METKGLPEMLKKGAWLKVEGRKDIKPSRVAVIELGDSMATVLYLFPRTARLGAGDKRVEFDARGVDYLIQKWYRPTSRPFRMCQPRDILDQMMSIAKYNMERVNFSPDLIDAACATYFISALKKDFGAKVRME